MLAKVLMNYLQVALDHLTSPEQTCAAKGWTIQYNIHLICTIIEKVNRKAMLINLDQSRAFNMLLRKALYQVLVFFFWGGVIYNDQIKLLSF